ncbi:MAG: hypothetical protein A3K18_05120 [Lentisphaerae bacterium RIFOXYA12_64_32]|nr:MAG: hypothetical protein A3K18_05120 [Lentisphaerae bacterium RIFOXYA12_64_32]
MLLTTCALLVVGRAWGQSVIVDTSQLSVPEGGYASVQVRLNSAPAGTAVVDITRVSGDTDLVGSTVVLFELNVGSCKVALYDAETPLTVANLLSYVAKGEAGGYDQTIIHRSVPGFVVQGGGYRYNSQIGALEHIPTGSPVANEYALSNLRGTLAMAKSGGSPDSATSEWFVNLADNSSNLDFQNGGFTVFGEVIENGMTVIDYIAGLNRANLGGAFTSLPYVVSGGNNYYVMVNRASVTAATHLSFTSSNWNTPQTATFRAIPDNDLSNGTAVFRCQAPGGYVDVNLTESDDDRFQILVSPSEPVIPEGGAGTFRVRLSAQPAANVTVAVQHTGGDPELTVTGGSTLTFTPANWQTEQTVSLSAGDDADVAAGTARIRLTAITAPTVDVTVKEADDDSLAIVTDAAGLTVPEGGSATLSLHLSNAPSSTVQVLASLAGGDGSFSVATPATRSFTTTNWNLNQTFTVRVAEDNNDDVSGSDTLTLSFGATTDPTMPAVQIGLSAVDDDVLVVIGRDGPGTVTPQGNVYVDTNGSPLTVVQAQANVGATFFEWTGTNGMVASPSRLATVVIQPSAPGTLTAHFGVDSDGDDLPDSWEQEQIDASDADDIVNLTDLAPDEDTDGDGSTNRDEFQNNTSPLEYVIPLQDGWNLVGFAHRPLDNQPTDVFRDVNGQVVIRGPAWEWNTAARGALYTVASTLVSSRGYWVRSGVETAIKVIPEAAPPSDSIPLAKGWNLVAIPFKPADNSVANVFGDKVTGSVWEFQDQCFRKVTQVVPLRGYWVYAPDATTVQFTAP